MKAEIKWMSLFAAGCLAITVAGCSASGSGANTVPRPENDYKSEILTNVLQEKTYLEAITSYAGNGIDPRYYSFPYGFLNSQGIDPEQYRNGDKSCYCSAYIEKGRRTLNFALRAETDEFTEGTPYYLCYTVSYELNEREYGEYELLHRGGYIEAPFFVQELSQQKQAQIIAQAKITSNAYDSIYEELNSENSKLGELFCEEKTEFDFLGTTETEISLAIRTACAEKVTNGKAVTVNYEAKPFTVPLPQTEYSSEKLVLSVKPIQTEKPQKVVADSEITSYPCSFRRFDKTLI